MVSHVFTGKGKGKGPRFVSVLVFGLLLSGCAGAQSAEPLATATGSAGPTAGVIAPTSTPTATPTPTPTPAAVDPKHPSSWIIDFTSVGPLAVGAEMSAATQSMTAFTSSNDFTGCPSIVSFGSPGFPSFLITDNSDDGIVKQIVLQGGADSSEFTATSPRTSSGIGIGATLDELETAYPTLTDLNDYYVPHYALPDGNGNWINFSVVEGRVHTIVVHDTAFLPREICG